MEDPTVGTAGESVRAQFTPEEWRLLQFAPFWVLSLVGAADGKINQREILALAGEMDGASSYTDPLVREVLASSAYDFTQIWDAYTQDRRSVEEGLADVVALLESRLSPERAREFKGALSGISYIVADASGGFLGLGKRVSRVEGTAMAQLVQLLNLESDKTE